ncbi:MAG TPA: hypothetical protein VGQ57_03140 [Polyangiaceae bacterium]|nr:hypothetical protein [Polyangiaceae bacterium]
MTDALTLPVPELGASGADYERFLRETPDAGEEYLRSEARVRFEPHDDDVLVAAPGLAVGAARGGASLQGGPLPGPLFVPDVSESVLSRVLAAFDGSATLAAARASAGLEPAAERALLRAAFGIALFAPHAVTALERAVPCAEIVRFPGAPYEIVRNYWQNMAAVRAHFAELEASAGDARRGFVELTNLHVLALVGDGGRSFYRPASRVVRHGLTPGALYTTQARLEETPSGTRLLEGPRVHAPFLGGEGYALLLAEQSGDPEATLERRQHEDDGLDWGRVVTASAAGDAGPAPWFLPPRPITLAHAESLFDALRRALSAAQAREQKAALEGLADFHQRFVRLHPFRACNQALAMNLVNAVLARVAGAGMPHLVLDHLALRFAPAAYRRLFALAARQWCVEGTPAARLTHLFRKKSAYFGLVSELGQTHDADAAAIVARAAPDAARLALLDLT